MPEERIPEEISTLEGALGALRLRASGVDRDRVMYLAGKSAGETAATLAALDKPAVGPSTVSARAGRTKYDRLARWLWPIATAVSLGLGVTVSYLPEILLPHEPKPAPKRADEIAQRPNPTEQVDQDAQAGIGQANSPLVDYLRLRNLVMTQGIDALPEPSGGGPSGREAFEGKATTPADPYRTWRESRNPI